MVHEAQKKLVQEVAAGDLGGAPPSNYILRESDRPTAGVPTVDFPTVDLRRLADPCTSTEETSKVRCALLSWGAFAVSGHGIPAPLLDGLLAAARQFFHRPPAEKLLHSNVVAAAADSNAGEKFQPEGYGVDRVDTDEQVLDWCDRLYLQVSPPESRQLRFWPSHPPSLRRLLEDFTAVSGHRVAAPLLAAMGTALGFPDSEGVDFAGKLGGDRAATYARLTYYPPCPRPDLVNGVKPHTDSSIVIVLLLDPDVGGLQILKRHGDASGGDAGEWVNAQGLGHDLLVIVGDEMEIMSNGVFRAPMHRVVASRVFFPDRSGRTAGRR